MNKLLLILGLIIVIGLGAGLYMALQPEHKHHMGMNERTIAADKAMTDKLVSQLVSEGMSPEDAYRKAWVCPICNGIVYDYGE